MPNSVYIWRVQHGLSSSHSIKVFGSTRISCPAYVEVKGGGQTLPRIPSPTMMLKIMEERWFTYSVINIRQCSVKVSRNTISNCYNTNSQLMQTSQSIEHGVTFSVGKCLLGKRGPDDFLLVKCNSRLWKRHRWTRLTENNNDGNIVTSCTK